MSPDVGAVLGSVWDPPVSDPAVGVEAEQAERTLHGLAVPQLHRMAPCPAVCDHYGLDLSRADSRSIDGF